MRLKLRDSASAAGGDYCESRVAYEHCSDSTSGRIVLSAEAVEQNDPAWTCGRVAQELTLFLRQLYTGQTAVCDQKTLEWNLFDELLQLNRLPPRPLATAADRDDPTRGRRYQGFSNLATHGTADEGAAVGSSAINFPGDSAINATPVDSATLAAMLAAAGGDELDGALVSPETSPHSSTDLGNDGDGTQETTPAEVATLRHEVSQLRARNAALEAQLAAAAGVEEVAQLRARNAALEAQLAAGVEGGEDGQPETRSRRRRRRRG